MVDGKVYKLALLPSGLVQGKLSVIGNGVVVDPWHLVDEIAKIEVQGVRVTPDLLVLADNACLIPAPAPGPGPGARGLRRQGERLDPQHRHHGARHRSGL